MPARIHHLLTPADHGKRLSLQPKRLSLQPLSGGLKPA
jgi:hypothetical protein